MKVNGVDDLKGGDQVIWVRGLIDVAANTAELRPIYQYSTDALTAKQQAQLAESVANQGAVLDYLIEKGLEPERLESHGYGENQPLDDRNNEQAWAKNRRVEFLIIKRANE